MTIEEDRHFSPCSPVWSGVFLIELLFVLGWDSLTISKLAGFSNNSEKYSSTYQPSQECDQSPAR